MSKDAPFPPSEVPVVAITFEQAIAAFREVCSTPDFDPAELFFDEIHPVSWGWPAVMELE